jgi:hypothetical protein
MSDAEKRSRVGMSNAIELPGKGSPGAPAPGKQTLVAAVQQRAAASGRGEATVHAAAARGLATSSSALPHAETIQRSFGRHDISSVQAHTGPEAAASARDMGADAYATGDHVVLGKGNDLATVAHEAAHVVQQRGGVQLKGGVGQEGDPYERHADEVAERVVQGKSAEGLLDQHAGGGASSGSPATGAGPTQRKLSVAGADEANVEVVWARIAKDPRLEAIQDEARALLQQWIENLPRYGVEETDKVSSNRAYASDEELIRGLVGDLRAAGNLAREGELARQTIDEGHVNSVLGTILARLQEFQNVNSERLPSSQRAGRYGGWTYPKGKMQDAVGKDPGDLRGRISIIADYALAVKGDVPKQQWNFMMGAEHGEARGGHWNTNESAPWVEEARQHDMPLSAGPSATTAQVLALSDLLQCSVDEKTALAWALFALWSDMPLNLAGTHRFHEVMDVAVLHGVPYEKFQYGEPPKGKQTDQGGSQ